MITIGTAHFVSKVAANRYYKPYGFNAADVQRKLDDGDIKLDKPALCIGQTLQLIDEGTRYAVTSPEYYQVSFVGRVAGAIGVTYPISTKVRFCEDPNLQLYVADINGVAYSDIMGFEIKGWE
ncbi:MAG: hypothetical protein BWK73_20020 [Thiothrix lacustris]|uniref:Uncharacterized protein n=1 Tax=Thiothrix lacustris TaxID=525917 RepID=A0A1Y1QPC2_9GAMM|nr:MAG: hypothetical protein BWK73_20020 [Thiothrix lacustris]